ncbi:MAG: HlyD family type I secretion periplasmic adaptor subunit [Roseovarius confluentis]
MSRRPVYSARLPLALGFLSLAFLIGALGVWSVSTQISGAVVADGLIVVENNRQIVQHAEGGVVGAVLARDGDLVAAGDLLLRLDGTLLRSELAIAELQLVELGARRARLEAERDDAQEFGFAPHLADTQRGPAAEQVEGQRMLFLARRDTLEQELIQIDERIRQSGNQIEGTAAQLTALSIQEGLITDELTDQESHLQKGLVQAQRVSTLQREAARLAGEIGMLTSEIARLKGQIATLEIEKLRLVGSRREAAIVELRDIQVRELELAERRFGLLERLARLDIRAPVSGVVYGSTVFAEKAVVRQADALMYIVPQDQPLIVSARVEAIHIDEVQVGQDATLRFTAFNQRRTPEIMGRVTAISADVIRDDVTGLNFYRVDLMPFAEDLDRLGSHPLVPGMPVEAFLRTGERTPLSYLTKPLTDYFGRAMREG